MRVECEGCEDGQVEVAEGFTWVKHDSQPLAEPVLCESCKCAAWERQNCRDEDSFG